jgi:tyrosine-protein kinase Etk/Wzc
MEYGNHKKTNQTFLVDASSDQQTQVSDSEEIYLVNILSDLAGHKWLYITSLFISLTAAFSIITIRQPIYQAESLIQIENTKSGIESTEFLEVLLNGDTSVSAEIEILNSRMILERVVEAQNLDIQAIPNFFPLVGSTISRFYEGDSLNSALFGLSNYAWGGEEIQVDSLSVGEQHIDRPLTLTVGKGDTYLVSNTDKTLEIKGTIGKLANDDSFSIFVSTLVAREGTEFIIKKLSTESAVNKIKNNFFVNERGKQSGILKLSYTSHDVKQASEILNNIQDTYLRLNVERRSAEAEKTLAFLETQLPDLKRQVNEAEAAYNEYRQARGSLDLNIETQGVLKSLIDIEDAIMLLKQEREELRQRFTSDHPIIKTIDAKHAKLKERRERVNKEVSRLPDTQQTILRLARDVEVSTNLYTELLKIAQQLRVSKAGTIGEVRIIDRAASSRHPIGVSPSVIIAFSCVLGFLASVTIILAQRGLRTFIDDPESIEAKIGLPVYATIPHSKSEAKNNKKYKIDKQSRELLAVINPDDSAVESMRSLRTALYFALLDATHSSLLISGPSPLIGKTFLAKNLSVVLAQLGKKIILVDADLRKGRIHLGFGLSRENGVSEYVANRATLSEIIKETSIPNLYVVTTGQIPPNPSELLMHLRFEQLLSELKNDFDSLIVDAPPVLAVSDSAIIGRYVGATLLVARSGKHSAIELEQTVKILRQSGVNPKGFVFNDFDVDRQRKRHGNKGYVYQYSYTNENT